jgi:hypothetical protein
VEEAAADPHHLRAAPVLLVGVERYGAVRNLFGRASDGTSPVRHVGALHALGTCPRPNHPTGQPRSTRPVVRASVKRSKERAPIGVVTQGKPDL